MLIGDIVVEASGSSKVLEDAINYVRRGGKLVCYGVYPSSARVSWPPAKIFGDGKLYATTITMRLD